MVLAIHLTAVLHFLSWVSYCGFLTLCSCFSWPSGQEDGYFDPKLWFQLPPACVRRDTQPLGSRTAFFVRVNVNSKRNHIRNKALKSPPNCEFFYRLQQIPLTSSIHVWRYNPFLPPCLPQKAPPFFSALTPSSLTSRTCNAALWITSYHLFHGIPTGLLLWNFPASFYGSFYLSFL